MSSTSHTAAPVFSAPALWALRVLAWLAFGVTAYLAWHVISQTSVAGCSVGSHNGCDAVLNSPWSKWLGIPVAVAGLACYTTLAGLSVLLGIRDSRASRWITTAFVMLAILAGGASLWFIALQIFVIGDFCRYCMPTDLCGTAIGAIATWSAATWWNGTRHLRRSKSSASGLMALRSALPSGARSAPLTAARTAPPTAQTAPPARARTVAALVPRTAPAIARRDAPMPSFPIAIGGAMAMLVVLIGGQIVFPAKNYDVQEVALNKPIELVGSNANGSNSTPSADAETRVAMRVPAEEDGDEAPSNNVTNTERTADGEDDTATRSSSPTSAAPEKRANNGSGGASPSPSSPSPSTPAESKPERKLKFLGEKLTLDVYRHPLIGSPDAKHVIVELISYDCPHCRKTHRIMKQALSRYGDQVALIVLVVPLEKRCNPLITDPAASHAGSCTTARMALGIAKIKPASFPRFHDWLMSGKEDKPPALDSVIAKAYSMADRARLRELNGSDELDKQIAGNVNLFDTLRRQNSGNKEFGLPIQILGDHIMSGSVEKAADVYAAWEKHLGVKPR